MDKGIFDMNLQLIHGSLMFDFLALVKPCVSAQLQASSHNAMVKLKCRWQPSLYLKAGAYGLRLPRCSTEEDSQQARGQNHEVPVTHPKIYRPATARSIPRDLHWLQLGKRNA
ncbi:hypothetical protein PoB_003576700 [Plakobranchus ocellatus]|uniref:Uncharacterized protein n=1 Tax=Plakobranchus ocellatus TaxID=259542 RepID=A0AAV4APP2_9GAST|nr:hypothetical protein PoB_003576700 [Plakobranchus ocellatus]